MKRAELIDKWLKALESGEYRQAKGSLSVNYGKRNQSFCCLGVACVVAKDAGIKGVTDSDIQDGMVLPNVVAKKFGIDTCGEFTVPIEYRGHEHSDLASLNDSGLRFKTIARIIREQLAANNFDKL